MVGLGSDRAAGTADQGTEELVETEALLKGASQDRTDRMLGDSNRTCLDVSSAAFWSGQVRCRTRIKRYQEFSHVFALGSRLSEQRETN